MIFRLLYIALIGTTLVQGKSLPPELDNKLIDLKKDIGEKIAENESNTEPLVQKEDIDGNKAGNYTEIQEKSQRGGRSFSGLFNIFTDAASETLHQTSQTIHKGIQSVAEVAKAKVTAGKDLLNAQIAVGTVIPTFGSKVFHKISEGGQIGGSSSGNFHIEGHSSGGHSSNGGFNLNIAGEKHLSFGHGSGNVHGHHKLNSDGQHLAGGELNINISGEKKISFDHGSENVNINQDSNSGFGGNVNGNHDFNIGGQHSGRHSLEGNFNVNLSGEKKILLGHGSGNFNLNVDSAAGNQNSQNSGFNIKIPAEKNNENYDLNFNNHHSLNLNSDINNSEKGKISLGFGNSNREQNSFGTGFDVNISDEKSNSINHGNEHTNLNHKHNSAENSLDLHHEGHFKVNSYPSSSDHGNLNVNHNFHADRNHDNDDSNSNFNTNIDVNISKEKKILLQGLNPGAQKPSTSEFNVNISRETKILLGPDTKNIYPNPDFICKALNCVMHPIEVNSPGQRTSLLNHGGLTQGSQPQRHDDNSLNSNFNINMSGEKKKIFDHDQVLTNHNNKNLNINEGLNLNEHGSSNSGFDLNLFGEKHVHFEHNHAMNSGNKNGFDISGKNKIFAGHAGVNVKNQLNSGGKPLPNSNININFNGEKQISIHHEPGKPPVIKQGFQLGGKPSGVNINLNIVGEKKITLGHSHGSNVNLNHGIQAGGKGVFDLGFGFNLFGDKKILINPGQVNVNQGFNSDKGHGDESNVNINISGEKKISFGQNGENVQVNQSFYPHHQETLSNSGYNPNVDYESNSHQHSPNLEFGFHVSGEKKVSFDYNDKNVNRDSNFNSESSHKAEFDNSSPSLEQQEHSLVSDIDINFIENKRPSINPQSEKILEKQTPGLSQSLNSSGQKTHVDHGENAPKNEISSGHKTKNLNEVHLEVESNISDTKNKPSNGEGEKAHHDHNFDVNLPEYSGPTIEGELVSDKRDNNENSSPEIRGHFPDRPKVPVTRVMENQASDLDQKNEYSESYDKKQNYPNVQNGNEHPGDNEILNSEHETYEQQQHGSDAHQQNEYFLGNETTNLEYETYEKNRHENDNFVHDWNPEYETWEQYQKRLQLQQQKQNSEYNDWNREYETWEQYQQRLQLQQHENSGRNENNSGYETDEKNQQKNENSDYHDWNREYETWEQYQQRLQLQQRHENSGRNENNSGYETDEKNQKKNENSGYHDWNREYETWEQYQQRLQLQQQQENSGYNDWNQKYETWEQYQQRLQFQQQNKNSDKISNVDGSSVLSSVLTEEETTVQHGLGLNGHLHKEKHVHTTDTYNTDSGSLSSSYNQSQQAWSSSFNSEVASEESHANSQGHNSNQKFVLDSAAFRKHLEEQRREAFNKLQQANGNVSLSASGSLESSSSFQHSEHTSKKTVTTGIEALESIFTIKNLAGAKKIKIGDGDNVQEIDLNALKDLAHATITIEGSTPEVSSTSKVIKKTITTTT